jgi:hypothetical protein
MTRGTVGYSFETNANEGWFNCPDGKKSPRFKSKSAAIVYLMAELFKDNTPGSTYITRLYREINASGLPFEIKKRSVRFP